VTAICLTVKNMKKIMYLLLFALPVVSLAQKSDSLICKMISDSLPAGWSATYKNGLVTVMKQDSVWFYNGINAPVELTPRDHAPFGAHRGVYKMEIRVLPGWSGKQLRSAVKKNAEIMNKIYEKYRMGEIANKNGDYAPKNEDEQKRVDAYYKESEAAQSGLTVIPTINQEKNSFVVHSSISSTGLSIWPEKSSGEIFNTESKIYSILRR
jgi:hypothetical protein